MVTHPYLISTKVNSSCLGFLSNFSFSYSIWIESTKYLSQLDTQGGLFPCPFMLATN